MKPNLGILEDHLHAVNFELNKFLADEIVLYIKTRSYHWNIEGPNDEGLPELKIEMQYYLPTGIN